MAKPKTTKMYVNRPDGPIYTKDQSTVQADGFTWWVFEAKNLLSEGWGEGQVHKYIASCKDYAFNTIVGIIKQAVTLIKNSNFQKAADVIPIHTNRYNKLIKKLISVEEMDIGLVDGIEITMKDFWIARNKKIEAYINCLSTMYQKECLLQYHNKDFTVEINNEEKIEVKEVKPKHDLSKLTFTEQVELYNLIKKARRDENELAGISQAVTGPQNSIEDIAHEIVEKPNIEAVKQVPLPPLPYRSPITSSDPTIKLRETLAKLSAQRFKEAGGTLTEDEENLIKYHEKITNQN